MPTMNWNPVRELEALRREVERAFESYGVESWVAPGWRAAFLPGRSARTYPLLNMSEDKDHVYVEALAPGVDPATLDISVTGETLSIAGEKQAITADVKPEAFHRNERGAGRFVRTIELPVAVDHDKVTADYRNGILRITLPKSEVAKPKQITVNVN